MKVVIIDYGMGNLTSIKSAFKYLNVENIDLSNDYSVIKKADRLLLPGVGSYVKAMEQIEKLEIKKFLDERVLEKKVPILGICLGMQLLVNSSDEDGGASGLGYIDAECKKFDSGDLKVPHVGFNQVNINTSSRLFNNLEKANDFYFTHSYRVQSQNDINQSTCNYGEKFIAAYEQDNILGTQFHPELSQTNGLELLKNFIEKF